MAKEEELTGNGGRNICGISIATIHEKISDIREKINDIEEVVKDYEMTVEDVVYLTDTLEQANLDMEGSLKLLSKN